MNRTARSGRSAGAVLVGVLLLGGCARDGDAPATSSQQAVRPTAEASIEQGSFNTADVVFAQDMVLRKSQAVTVATLVSGRTENAQIIDLGQRITTTREPEIEDLTSWLTVWGQEMPDEVTDMTLSRGMLTDEDLRALEAASGAAFERMFLDLMIEHDVGALESTLTENTSGLYPPALRMATSTADRQVEEIGEMQRLLTDLGG
jgi:uncharacterized protein (DUF305 family)